MRLPRATGSRRKPGGHSVVLELDIVDLAPGGHGVAHVVRDGVKRTVFASGAAIGDKLRAEVDFGPRPARATTLAVVSPSGDRRGPTDIPCRHLAACGACDFMHLAPSAQVRAHESFVRSQLPAELREMPITVHGNPLAARSGAHSRGRARVHVLARPPKGVAVGMFARSTNTPIAVDTCVILEPAIDEARRALGALLQGARGEGEAHLAMGRTASSRAPVILLEWRGEPLPAAVYARAEAAVRDGRLAGLALDGALIGRPAPVADGADGIDLLLPVGGFAQAHGATNADLARAVVEGAMGLFGAAASTAASTSPTFRRTLVELYAGSGNLTVLLARALADREDALATRLVAVESVGAACEAARENLDRRGLASRVRVVQADADTFVAAWPEATRVVVLDPPRAGARVACEALARSKVQGVVMVSCDPATLGRDLATLASRFDLVRLSIFEMFPETSHVETLAVLRAKQKTR